MFQNIQYMNFQSALVEKLSDDVFSIFRFDYSREDLGLFVSLSPPLPSTKSEQTLAWPSKIEKNDIESLLENFIILDIRFHHFRQVKTKERNNVRLLIFEIYY